MARARAAATARHLEAVLPRTLAYAALEQVVDEVHPLVGCVGGGNNMPLLEAADLLGLQLVCSPTELGAAFVSSGVAWESGKVSLLLVITSAGVYGLIQALYCAYVNERPLVLISGEVGGIGRGSVQAGEGWDGPAVTEVTRPLTQWSIDAPTADLAYRAVRRAVTLAAAYRKPVHVNIPLSVLKEQYP